MYGNHSYTVRLLYSNSNSTTDLVLLSVEIYFRFGKFSSVTTKTRQSNSTSEFKGVRLAEETSQIFTQYPTRISITSRFIRMRFWNPLILVGDLCFSFNKSFYRNKKENFKLYTIIFLLSGSG